MKILFSGHHNPHFWTITEYIEAAIRRLGHELIVYEDRRHVVPGRIRQRISALERIDAWMINARLITLARRQHPDIAVITGGHRIHGTTIRRLREMRIRTALWTVDPPVNFSPVIEAAPFYDRIFCQGTEAVELLARAGINDARWLPMGCNPELHHSVEVSQTDRSEYGCDVAFVGSYYPEREQLLKTLTAFNLGVWGPGWEKLPAGSSLRRCLRGAHTPPDVWLRIYSASKIILATHYHDPLDRFPVHQASPRVFEALSCGAFVLCDRQRDVFSLFTDGEHLVGFDDADDLRAKTEYYLNHSEARQRIARQGRLFVTANHTYVHRVKELLSVAGNQG